MRYFYLPALPAMFLAGFGAWLGLPWLSFSALAFAVAMTWLSSEQYNDNIRPKGLCILVTIGLGYFAAHLLWLSFTLLLLLIVVWFVDMYQEKESET